MDKETFETIKDEENKAKNFMPIEQLNLWKGQKVIVTKKNGSIETGTLVSFDLNTNIVLETKGGNSFINGFSVLFVSEYTEESAAGAQKVAEEKAQQQKPAEKEATSQEEAPAEEPASDKPAEETSSEEPA